MVQYKWVALSNTTIGMLMASIDATIVLIAMPAIFRGIDINPLHVFPVPAVDNVRLQHRNRHFACDFWQIVRHVRQSKTLQFRLRHLHRRLNPAFPNAEHRRRRSHGTDHLPFGSRSRSSILFSNSGAIITDAFPENERGKALGINQLSFLAGSLIGLVLGGVLAVYDWRLVFLVSVPVGVIGTVWSYWKLKEQNVVRRKTENGYLGQHNLRRRLNPDFARHDLRVNALWQLTDGLGQPMGYSVTCFRSSLADCFSIH